jgi:DNA-binding transcriptional LysR family regulator
VLAARTIVDPVRRLDDVEVVLDDDRSELIPLLASFQPPAYPLHLGYPPSRYASNRLCVFIDWAAELFGRLA